MYFVTRLRSSWLPSLTDREKVAAIIGTLGEFAVTLGVVGEFIIHWLYARATHRLEDLTDEESVAQRLEIARLDSEAEAARGAIAEANARAAEANQKAEEERLARVKLEKSLEIRSLTIEQRDKIASALLPFAGQECTLVRGEDGSEVRLTALSVITVLRAAAWKEPIVVDARPRLPIFGALVEISPDADAQTVDTARALSRSFADVGWEIYGPVAWKEAIVPLDPAKQKLPPPNIQLVIGTHRYITR